MKPVIAASAVCLVLFAPSVGAQTVSSSTRPAQPAVPGASALRVQSAAIWARPPFHRPIHHAAPALRRVAEANRGATQEPAAQGFINAAQIYPYADGALYKVYTAPERVTDIALQPGEALVAVAAGDTVRWVIGDTTSGSGVNKRTHILVKPFAANLSTNVVITTDRRSYHLSLNSTTGAAMAALSWTYPQDELIALRRVAEERQASTPISSGFALDQLHFNYEVSGDQPAWRPLRAFDDGRQTFIEFPATLGVGEAPPLFLVDPKGEAQLVNYRLQGRFYVVDRIFDAAELRLGTKKQQIVRITRVTDASQRRRGS
jgi:P-type conjugative transfer protein TrbG